MSHLRLCRATKLRDKIAGVTSALAIIPQNRRNCDVSIDMVQMAAKRYAIRRWPFWSFSAIGRYRRPSRITSSLLTSYYIFRPRWHLCPLDGYSGYSATLTGGFNF